MPNPKIKAQKLQANSFQTQSNETATADIEQTLDNFC